MCNKSILSKHANLFLVDIYTRDRFLFPSLSSNPDLVLGSGYQAIIRFDALTLHEMESELAH